ncbi:SAM-dependent methyltransferase [Petroclostridium sp. X23]|uniref:class I SAM-dependent methyltransferase n=1 Tax=Petroclostridium sp. X23 TaxID=3045146 RepID=UPI0024AE7803|nr:SAM-dependent methyltransferase [Petroclostridium sp. X23]WHH58193.1 SAM-dependent methyltransferase [Petroclostridium sp. X23]
MNKQNIAKLKMFLMGLEQRINDNQQYFKNINIIFGSGTKDFPARVMLEDTDVLKINYSGSNQTIIPSQLSQWICKESEKYDEVHIRYEERGTNILIDGTQKGVKIKYEDDIKEEINKQEAASHIGNRDYIIKVGQADELLKEIGILTKDGKVKNDMIRKYNQIDHFVELMKGVVDELADYESITVLDCGCGKSYLTFVLNFYMKNILKKSCHFIGLDYSETVIKASKKMAKNLGYVNMEFHQTNIENYVPEKRIDIVISLHACDTATDMALALGIRVNAKVIIAVPCCHRELLSQYDYEPFKSIIKHGVLKARMADILTDGLRALKLESLGYKVSIVEYISPLETPKNLMIRAVKTQQDNKNAKEEYNQLVKALNVAPALDRLYIL